MIKNIIFDIDGTLADTSDDIIDSLNVSLMKFGFKKKINFSKFKKVANKGSIHMIKEVLGKNNKKEKEINNFFLKYYEANICNKSKLKSNVLDFLKFCKKKLSFLFLLINWKKCKIVVNEIKDFKLF